MNKFLKISLIAVVCGSLLLTGCDREEEEESSTPSEIVVSGGDISEPEKLPFPVTVCGVRLEKAVERAVSLSPAATEIICELGFQGTLVGVSGYCDYPEGLSLPQVGSTENPDINAIIALRPDAVFTLSELSEREAYTLDRAGIAVLTADMPVNMEGYSAMYKEIASAFYGKELTDSQKDVSKALQAGKDARSALEKAARSVEPYTFVYVTEKLTIAGEDTFESAVLSISGENNCTDGGYISAEELDCETPMLLIADDTLDEDDIYDNEQLSEFLYDGAELRFVNSRCFERPTARTAEVFASLAASAPETDDTEETAEDTGEYY
ncbi:MAG: helical backbone metal receptor [Lachnospiraceae bacterium]|nr:helical backbone metal receptor [Ruminococcus sp.]MCM1275081.1 helical backbone metal receptor [Lachnospiraceae bacterium]